MENRKRKEIQTFVHLDVDRAPPDIILASVFIDDAFILWAATGLFTGKVDESTGRRYNSAFVPDCVFIEQGNRGVTFKVDLVHVEAGLREILKVAADEGTELLSVISLSVVFV
jgi:hypothetical protein